MCDEDGFARALARIAVAQIVYAQAEGLEASGGGGGGGEKKGGGGGGKGRISAEGVSAQSAVVAALADILGAYVQNAGARARARAEHAGRGAVGLRDVLFALERFGGTRVQTSTRDLATYARIERVAFPRAVPAFPAAPAAPGAPPTASAGAGAQHPAGAEAWMPPLPPSHTYHATPGITGGGATRRPGRADLALQRRQVGASLARLQEDAAAAVGGVVSGGGSAAGAGAVGGDNPYLRPPTVGGGGGRVEERAECREPTEALPAPTMRESNRQPPRITEPDAKRLRIDRVLKDSGGVTGVSSGAGGGGAGAPTGGPGTPAMPIKDGIKGVLKAASDKPKTAGGPIKDGASAGAKSKGNGASKTKSGGGGGTGGSTKSKSAAGGTSSMASGGKPLSATAAAAATATPLSASSKK